MKLEAETKTGLAFTFEGKVYLYRDSEEELPEWMQKACAELGPRKKQGELFAEILTGFLSAPGVLREKGGREHNYANFFMIKEPTDYKGWCVVDHPLLAIASNLTLEDIDRIVEPSKKIISIEYPARNLRNFYEQSIKAGLGYLKILCFGNNQNAETMEKIINGGTLEEIGTVQEFIDAAKEDQNSGRFLLASKEGFEAIRYSESLHRIETDNGDTKFIPVIAYICSIDKWDDRKAWRLIESTISYPIKTKKLNEICAKLEEIIKIGRKCPASS